MYDVISIGSSVVDSFIKSDAFKLQKSSNGTLLCQTYGEKIDVDQYLVRTGGGGSNTAVGFTRMGFKTAVVSELGTDSFSEYIQSELQSELVDKKFLVTEKNEQTGGSIILLGEDGGRTIMVHRGASAQLDPHDIPKQVIKNTKWIHLSSISGRLETLKTIFQTVAESDAKLSWNPGNAELTAIATGNFAVSDIAANILIVNKEEWMQVAAQQQALLAKIPEIVVTNGAAGGELFIKGKPHLKFLSEPTQSHDDTGAGDAFIVGYVTGHIKGKTVLECANWGKKNAKSVIQQVGAKPGLLTIDQLTGDTN